MCEMRSSDSSVCEHEERGGQVEEKQIGCLMDLLGSMTGVGRKSPESEASQWPIFLFVWAWPISLLANKESFPYL